MNKNIPLDGSATVQTIDAIRTLLLDAFQAHEAVTLDVSALQSVDLSLLQLVEAARLHAASENKAFALTAPAPAALAALLDRAGFLADATPDTLAFWFHGDPPQ